jgi:anti-anti-sigma regulatory factor
LPSIHTVAISIFSRIRNSAPTFRSRLRAATANDSIWPADVHPGQPAQKQAATRDGGTKSSTEDQAAGEAARLYAGGNRAGTRAYLERLVHAEFSDSERLWRMLLALHEQAGERRLFDEAAQDFAIRFKQPVQAWQEHAPSARTFVSLAGRASAQSAPEIARVRAAVDEYRDLHLDLSKLKGIDPAGCAMLLSFLQAIRERGGDSIISGDGKMALALAKVTRSGARHVAAEIWLLRLELLRWHGRQAEFEKVGKDYAITFGTSPLSHELIAPINQCATFVTPGEIEGFNHFIFEELRTYSASRSVVQVDLSGLKRIDFWAAMHLIGFATQLNAEGKRLEFSAPNALVSEWLEALGLSAVASVVPRRA